MHICRQGLVGILAPQVMTLFQNSKVEFSALISYFQIMTQGAFQYCIHTCWHGGTVT